MVNTNLSNLPAVGVELPVCLRCPVWDESPRGGWANAVAIAGGALVASGRVESRRDGLAACPRVWTWDAQRGGGWAAGAPGMRQWRDGMLVSSAGPVLLPTVRSPMGDTERRIALWMGSEWEIRHAVSPYRRTGMAHSPPIHSTNQHLAPQPRPRPPSGPPDPATSPPHQSVPHPDDTPSRDPHAVVDQPLTT